MQPGNSFRSLQALRAAACLLVVLYHALQAGAGEAAIRAWPNGSAGVDLFFVISGFIMVTSSRDLAGRRDPALSFCRRRLRRIVPLYWLLTALKLGIIMASPALTPHSTPTAWNMAASLVFIPARDAAGLIRPILPVGWTLDFEMLFYAAFAGAMAFRISPLRIIPVLAVLALAGFWRTDVWPAPLALANGMVMEFAAGMLLATWLHRALPRRPVGLPLGLAGIAIILLLAVPSCGPWRCFTWGIPATVLVACALTREAQLSPLLPAWLTEIGDASYAIYLVHPFVIGAIGHHGAAAAFAAIPLSVAAGLVVHRAVDVPMQRALRPGTRMLPEAG